MISNAELMSKGTERNENQRRRRCKWKGIQLIRR